MERQCGGPISLPAQPSWVLTEARCMGAGVETLSLGPALVLMLDPPPPPPDCSCGSPPTSPPHCSFRSLLTWLLSCWHIDHSLLLKTLSFSAAVALPSPPSSAQVPLPMLPLLLSKPLGTPSNAASQPPFASTLAPNAIYLSTYLNDP